ncbi:ribonuclease III family protein [Blattabacterium cuenoti]|uniref:ribonuclease III family protein n=1 Tax=Blattabacterium cuenoti TaxID=1653831 RepID=UPI00163C8257|nr:ribonuclease III domain-containing protein [Blattabacterium cuenoti]
MDHNNNDKDFILVKKLERILGFFPKNINGLKEVFIYNFSSKRRNFKKNYSINFQRLEFLGDAVLNTIISHFLLEKFPEKKEGELTRIRSQIVCRKNLNEISKKIDITDIFFDKKMIYDNNVLGNTLEALIGFIYLELGYDKCQDFVYQRIINHHVNVLKLQHEIFSYKVWIIEWCQKKKFFVKFNTFREETEKNINIYLSEFKISECDILTKGRGSSKKKSEEMAAKKAYFIVNGKEIRNI